MPTITPLPTPPSRSDPTNFSARADAFLQALVLFQQELNAATAGESAAALAVSLANNVDAAKGLGLLGFGPALSYPAGSAGAQLSRAVVGDTGRQHRLVAMVLRNDGAGWGYISDTDHAPVGMGAITVTPSGGAKVLRTSYSFTAVRVLSLFGATDETLAARGLLFGPSVGLTYADWRMYLPFSCWVDKNAGAFSFGNIDAWLGSGTDSTVAATGGITDGSSFTITHLASSDDDVPVATLIRGNAAPSLDIAVTYGATSIRVDYIEDMHGFVYYDGTTWQVQTPNSNKPTFSFSAGVLTVTHENIGDVYDTLVCGVGSTHVVTTGVPSGVAATRATSFLVSFQDYAGSTVSSANSNMRFHYRRARKVRTVPPDGARVAIRRGPVLLDPDKVVSASGNIWALGLLEVA